MPSKFIKHLKSSQEFFFFFFLEIGKLILGMEHKENTPKFWWEVNSLGGKEQELCEKNRIES